MLPTALRPGGDIENDLWDAYAFMIADFLAKRTKPQADMLYLYFWTRVVTQHYGPGSLFLDVTEDLNVALWFALHRRGWKEITFPAGEPGPPAPSDRPDNRTWVRYQAIDSGWIYVLDLPELVLGDDNLPTECIPGGFLQSNMAPPEFRTPRTEGQKAGLAYGDPSIDGGDFSRFIVGEPLQVSASRDRWNRPISQNTLFPSPENDVWYRRLISVPATPEIVSGRETGRLVPRLPVTLYFPDDRETFRNIVDTYLISLDGHPWPPNHGMFAPWRKGKETTNGPIHLVAEMPLVFTTPPAEHHWWNQIPALLTNLPTEVRSVANVGSGGPAVSLSDCLLEFSPLERHAWDEILRGDSRERPVGVRFRRGDRDVQARFALEDPMPGGGQSKWYEMTIAIDRGDLMLGRAHLRDVRTLAKAFYVLIMVLHELRPEGHACLVPVEKNGHVYYFIRRRDNEKKPFVYLVREISGAETSGVL